MDTRAVRLSGSMVEAGETEDCDARETELSDGDSRLELRWWWFERGSAAGDSAFALPKVRPPPSDLPGREVMMVLSRESQRARLACWAGEAVVQLAWGLTSGRPAEH